MRFLGQQRAQSGYMGQGLSCVVNSEHTAVSASLQTVVNRRRARVP